MDSAPRTAVDAALRAAADRFLERLLDAAPDARAAMIAALRFDEPELAALVDSLLVHLDAVDGFLEEPIRIAVDDERTDDADVDGAAVVGTRFGHWEVRRTIGHGGMGLVFEVERVDGVVNQRAALKLIKRGFDDHSILARFTAERQILAGLDHPSIARLIDAGAAQGRPYLVMEYIDGVSLDRWCSDRGLTIDQRIALFNQVCAAVHYAHQRLVVHRDLKPGNILVTADGLPKLLDFGISKLIGADGASAASAETIDAAALLTPRYASPEQLTGAPISTASDVYSLGVLLYELLTGTTPYRTRNDSIVEMMRVVTTDEPTRPSQALGRRDGAEPIDPRLAKRLRGDLDHILMKALARDPAERYESASALRDDLVRHLAGDPVKASASSWRYRAGKFVRRHRAAVSLTAVVAFAIVALGVVASYQAWRAERAREVADEQRARAERRFDDTRNLAKAMLFDVDDAIATGPTKAREQLVRTALTYLDRLSRDRLTPDLQGDVAEGYERIAMILGDGSSNNLGRTDEAKQYLLKSLALRERLAAAAPDDPRTLKGLVSVDRSLGNLIRFIGSPEQAAGYFAAATRFATRYAALHPDDIRATLDVFGRRRDEALIRYVPGRPNLNRYDEALERYRALLADMDAYATTHPEMTTRHGRYFGAVLNDMTRLYRLGGDAQSALATSERDLAISAAALDAAPDNPETLRGHALSLRATGDSLMELGREDEGFALLRQSMAIRDRLLREDPTSVLAARDVAIGHAMLGYAYDLSGHPREALGEYQQWAARADAALQKAPGNVGHRLDLEQARCSIAEMRLALGETARARDEALQVEREVLALDATMRDESEAREALGKARAIAARGMVAANSRAAGAEAFALARRGIENLDANRAKTPEDAFAARDAARARLQAGIIGFATGVDRTGGCRLVIEGRDLLQALRDRRRLTVQFDPVLAEANAAAERCRGVAAGV